MTNAEALHIAEEMLALADELRSPTAAPDVHVRLVELCGRLRSVIVSLLPKQSIVVGGSWGSQTTHDNVIEAGYLGGTGAYQYEAWLQLIQLVGMLRGRAEKHPDGNADDQNEDGRTSVAPFVDPARLDELRALPRATFDFQRLVRICEELNVGFASGLYHAVALLTRAVLDHVPPVFGFRTFNEVASNVGGTSFKESMDHLHKSARKIADSHLHQHIRKSESLPNATQVNFSRDLDVLLAEIVRISK